jgi:hypothetical protein
MPIELIGIAGEEQVLRLGDAAERLVLRAVLLDRGQGCEIGTESRPG